MDKDKECHQWTDKDYEKDKELVDYTPIDKSSKHSCCKRKNTFAQEVSAYIESATKQIDAIYKQQCLEDFKNSIIVDSLHNDLERDHIITDAIVHAPKDNHK